MGGGLNTPNPPRYATDAINGMFFEKKKRVIEHKTCVLIFCTILPEIFFILKRTERDVIINAYFMCL